ncbi:glycosyltransferase family 4 protein, partial [Acidobacteriota bacterium]
MKKILIVTSDVPFVEGGHRTISRGLKNALQAAGYACEIWKTPQNRYGRQISAYISTWLTDLELTGYGAPVDGVISLRYPSYAVRHPRHVCWLVHRMREYYDLWDSLKNKWGRRGRLKEGTRRFIIHRIDRRLLTKNVSRVFTISATVKERLQRWGGIPSEVLYPPPPDRPYRTDRYEPFLLAYSRLDALKRFDLMLEAFRRAGGDLKLKIAGEGPEKPRLEKMTEDFGLSGRVSFLGRISADELVDELARCRGVFFAPFHEDLGFVTMEAFQSRKPVITATDSGGPLEFVKDMETGLVAEPDPQA